MLQDRHDAVDEVLVATGTQRRTQHEAIAAFVFEQVLQLIGNGFGRADKLWAHLIARPGFSRFAEG